MNEWLYKCVFVTCVLSDVLFILRSTDRQHHVSLLRRWRQLLRCHGYRGGRADSGHEDGGGGQTGGERSQHERTARGSAGVYFVFSVSVSRAQDRRPGVQTVVSPHQRSDMPVNLYLHVRIIYIVISNLVSVFTPDILCLTRNPCEVQVWTGCDGIFNTELWDVFNTGALTLPRFS